MVLYAQFTRSIQAASAPDPLGPSRWCYAQSPPGSVQVGLFAKSLQVAIITLASGGAVAQFVKLKKVLHIYSNLHHSRVYLAKFLQKRIFSYIYLTYLSNIAKIPALLQECDDGFDTSNKKLQFYRIFGYLGVSPDNTSRVKSSENIKKQSNLPPLEIVRVGRKVAYLSLQYIY